MNRTTFLALASLLAIGCSAGTPTAGDAKTYLTDQLRANINGKTAVTAFEKADGLKSMKDGVETYELEFVATTEMPGGPWEHDTYRGKVTFIRTENGWRPVHLNVASDAETAARQKQEEDGRMEARAKHGIRTLVSALNLYKLDNFTYPTTEQGLRALVEAPKTEPLAKNWKPEGYVTADRLKDPWGNDYHYESPGKHGDVDVYTLGADQAPGGYDVVNQDWGNWDLGE